MSAHHLGFTWSKLRLENVQPLNCDNGRIPLWSGHLLPLQSFLQVSQQMTNVIGFKIRSSETIIICVCGADRFALLPFLAILPPSTLQMLAANFT